jgi:hypothetical protein
MFELMKSWRRRREARLQAQRLREYEEHARRGQRAREASRDQTNYRLRRGPEYEPASPAPVSDSFVDTMVLLHDAPAHDSSHGHCAEASPDAGGYDAGGYDAGSCDAGGSDCGGGDAGGSCGGD